MLSRYLMHGMIVLLATLALVSGCSRKIVRPNQAPQGPVAPFGAGQILEQELQGVQAELRIVYFDYDKYSLSPEAQTALQYNAELLKRVPNVNVVSEGHCDERGTSEYNLALGERRARSVVDYLVGLGIVPNRMTTVSYGSECPVDPAHNEAAWAKNRRVFLRVSR
jgi:peptidoglycan-associated lipoprotein